MNNNRSSASVDVTVFVNTSLDTNLAVTISGDDTVSDLKKKLENEHRLSHREGEIMIRALKVDRKGSLYLLSDYMLVKAAASEGAKECFLFGDVCIVERVGRIEGGCDNSFDVVSKRLLGFDSVPLLLLEGNKHVQDGSGDSGREISKGLEMGIKHFDDDHRKTSVDETVKRRELEMQDDHGRCSDGFRVFTSQEKKESTLRKEMSEDKSSASFGKASPSAKSEETVNLKQNDASVTGVKEEQSRIDIVPPVDSLGNEGGDVPSNMVVVNRNTTEESCRALASNMDNRSTEISGEHADSGNDTSMHCSTAVKGTSQPRIASKKKRKFENITDLEDSLKKNNVLIIKEDSQQDASESRIASKKKHKVEKVTDLQSSIKENSDSNRKASQPEIATELSAGKTASTTLDGSLAETSDLLTNSTCRTKNKKKKKSSNTLHQVVNAALSGSGDMAERYVVASAGTNSTNPGREDVAPISGQDLKEDNGTPILELQENCKAPSSLGVSKCHSPETRLHQYAQKLGIKTPVYETTKGGPSHAPSFKCTVIINNVRYNSFLGFTNRKEAKHSASEVALMELSKSGDAAQCISQPAVEVERAQEKREPSQTNDSKAMLSEIQGRTEGNNAKLVVTSLLDTNEPVTPCKKKNKKKKTKGSTGAEHITDSQRDISLAEPYQAVQGEQDSDKAKNKESNLSQKNGKEISEKDTGNCQLVLQVDKHDGDEVETSQQVGKPPANAKSMKKKSKRKHDAMTEDLQKLEAEERSASHQDPTLITEKRTEALASKRKKSKVAKTTPIDQSNAKCLEMSLEPNLSGKHAEVSYEGEEIDFHKYMMPSQSKKEAVASGEVHAEEVMKSKMADNKLKPEKTVSNKVSKSKTKAQSSDASSMMNFTPTPKVAGKHSLDNASGVNSLNEKKNEAVAISSSKTEKINNEDQNRAVKLQSGATQNVVASGKASGNDNGEVLNISKHKKSSATPVALEYRNGSSEDKEGVVNSGASSSSSEYSLSSESDYSDGKSNAGSCASSGKKDAGRSCYSTVKGKSAKSSDIFVKSSSYRKAKLNASLSQLEDSHVPEIVPDSEPGM